MSLSDISAKPRAVSSARSVRQLAASALQRGEDFGELSRAVGLRREVGRGRGGIVSHDSPPSVSEGDGLCSQVNSQTCQALGAT